jgi:hypothetical protein
LFNQAFLIAKSANCGKRRKTGQPAETIEGSNMPAVRGNPASKWQRRAAVATDDYKAGITNPRQSWETATSEASDIHKQATMEALNRGAFRSGVEAAGDEKWKSKSLGKGADRYAPGVADATKDYESAVAPYLDTIESVKLPMRGPKGDPKNIQRVAVIAKALRDKKLQIQGKK